MKLLNTLVCSLLALNMFAAEYPVSLAVNGFGGQKTLVTKVEGDLSIILDTLTADRFGLFKTTFTDDDETGFYKFIFPQLNNAEVPFIFNKEDIAITTEAVNPNAYIQVMVSKENSLYYQFVMNDAIFNNQVELLETVYNNYIGEEFKAQAEAEYSRLLVQHAHDMALLRKQGANTFAWKIIQSQVVPVPPMLLSNSDKNTFLKSHYFDNVDFTDTALINSDVFTMRAIRYLSVYSQQIQQSNKNAIFMSAVDTILKKASVNATTYDFVVDYLLGGFESMGASEIVTYISQKYLTEHSCNNGDATTLQRKALSNTELAVGKQAPLELLTAMNYKKDINFAEENVVLIFWATWCSHCVESIPQIVDHYAGIANPKYKLVTVSLDSTSNDWDKFLAAHPNFAKTKNLIDTNGWDGELAESYYIYATPSIYVLEKGKIVSKPIEYEDFLEMLKRFGWE